MTSPLLALFIRSVREDCRLKLTYFARAGLVLVILIFLFTTHERSGWANAPGLQFFGYVILIDFVFAILAGVSYFSSAITEEKEEVTLGLLRMTNLNPLSILLGKSTSRLCTAILLFFAQIPYTLLAITLGGISMQQVLAAYVGLTAFLIFVSNLALLGSVVCQRTSGAAIFTGIGLIFFFAFFPIAGALAQLPVTAGLLSSTNAWTGTLETIAELANGTSPISRYEPIFSTGFQESAFSLQVWSNSIMGVVFFLLAWALFERFCAEQKESEAPRVGVARTRGRWPSLSPARAWRRALAWKDFYFLGGGKLWLFIKLIIYGAPLFVARCWPKKLGGPPPWDDFGVGAFWLMAGFISVELVFAAGSVFRVERQGRTLSSLAMLPQGLRRVAYDKLLGIIPALSAAGIYLLLSLPLVAKPIHDFLDEFSFNSQSNWLDLIGFAFAFAQGIFFLHLVTNLSLRVKFGALPLAIGVYLLLVFFVGISSIGLLRNESGVLLLLILTVGATIFLHLNTGQRLVEIAAEE